MNRVYHYICEEIRKNKLDTEARRHLMQRPLPIDFTAFSIQTGSFSGHETFTLRYAWLKKGIDGIQRRPDLFQSEEAMVDLGVGKNMVRAIRHWCLATKVLEEGDFLPQMRTRQRKHWTVR